MRSLCQKVINLNTIQRLKWTYFQPFQAWILFRKLAHEWVCGAKYLTYEYSSQQLEVPLPLNVHIYIFWQAGQFIWMCIAFWLLCSQHVSFYIISRNASYLSMLIVSQQLQMTRKSWIVCVKWLSVFVSNEKKGKHVIQSAFAVVAASHTKCAVPAQCTYISMKSNGYKENETRRSGKMQEMRKFYANSISGEFQIYSLLLLVSPLKPLSLVSIHNRHSMYNFMLIHLEKQWKMVSFLRCHSVPELNVTNAF